MFIVPLKWIEYGFGYAIIMIPIYPIFYLLKGDERLWASGAMRGTSGSTTLASLLRSSLVDTGECGKLESPDKVEEPFQHPPHCM